ncbi:putative phosphoesterase [Alkalibacillus haloalkaliphilus]|uniref:Putative phosphoesterase AHA02nite_13890 n=1 Tax=Alkalibacillus haloalkaliphilus TaxID=94136 RepID=A0A511W6C2_9BACI|nr:putative phosphoesterase [Alkalibacillus haloalkaliphilus]
MTPVTYGIAIFPSKHIQDVANSYRMRYDPRYSLIPPHITLKEHFQATEGEIKQVEDACQKLADEMDPFDIEINRVSSFSPITHTVYLKVEDNEELTYLSNKMHEEPFPQERAHKFVPHITISQDLSEDEHSDVYGSLRLSQFDLKDTVDRFQLLYQLDDGSWTVHETFKFGKE